MLEGRVQVSLRKKEKDARMTITANRKEREIEREIEKKPASDDNKAIIRTSLILVYTVDK